MTRAPTAAELDAYLQHQKALEDGRDPKIRCGELAPEGLFCDKVKGHDGPHYYRKPGL